jgi:hypothetical protein
MQIVDAVVTDLTQGFDAGLLVASGLYSLRVPVLCLHQTDCPAPESLRNLRHPMFTMGAYKDERFVYVLRVFVA